MMSILEMLYMGVKNTLKFVFMFQIRLLMFLIL